MFNKYQFEKKQQEFQEIEKIREKFIKQKKNIHTKNDHLAIKYKKRVENFMMKMQSNPIIFQNPSKLHTFREENPEKFLDRPNLIINGPKSERERVSSLQQQNDIYVLEYKNPILNITRNRDKTLEVAGDLHFVDNHRLQRLHNQLNNQTLSILDKKQLEKVQRNQLILDDKQEQKDLSQKVIRKNFLPELHEKTHFQAVKSLNQKLPHFGFQLEIENNISEIKKDDFKKELEYIDQNSLSLLQNCNLNRKKRSNTKVLRMGQGKLISNPEQSISQIYQNLYIN